VFGQLLSDRKFALTSTFAEIWAPVPPPVLRQQKTAARVGPPGLPGLVRQVLALCPCGRLLDGRSSS